MDDLISRQMAIDAIEAKEANEYGNYLEYNVAFNDGLHSAVFAIEDLPSAQKRGEWIPHEDEDGEHYGDKCSECGEWYVMPYGKTNFCPNCGADMREE